MNGTVGATGATGGRDGVDAGGPRGARGAGAGAAGAAGGAGAGAAGPRAGGAGDPGGDAHGGGPRIDPTTLPGRPCSLASALQLVGDRWALQAIREVGFGNHQFSQIARNTGAPTDRLAARLKALVAAGVLERRPSPDHPRYPGYYLTPAGRDLGPAIRELLQWGDRWVVTEPPTRMWHHPHGHAAGEHELHTRVVCASCGEQVESADIRREMTAPGWDITGPVRDE
ncbi:helix-turn-helix domain-containing protein [Actinacidiphila sp. DG2A-62]|uniref:winged helix-turn-helix transcriptional regulator n=1 Tax=Actinacidiphila sp. DG2A-62 TaxID=3108821 RepID=UPI002DB9738D|nr:helix-turn-helix domain-containing protein [Actinacidiphila sp. DG2A-62]MEC3993900.1 helix-turn-helix domain-containing protein [Actinacidiphila sp. DG2A-62]